jgi:cytochrome P450
LAEATGTSDEALSVEESVSILLQMIIAGNESTASLIGSATRLLAEDPGLPASLRQDPSRIPLFVEEAVRLESPFQGYFRKTNEATELAGVALPEGARLMVLWASGNHDERVFDRPDGVDLEELLKRSTHFEMTGPARHVSRVFVRTPVDVPITVQG